MEIWNKVKQNGDAMTNLEYLQSLDRDRLAQIITRATYDLATGLVLDPENKHANQFDKYLNMVKEWLDMTTDRLDIFGKYQEEMINNYSQ